MILFVSRTEVSPEITGWVSREVGMELQQATSPEQAIQLLRQTEYRVAVVDSGLLEIDPKGVDHLLNENPGTVPVFPNLAVCGPERLLCEIKAALRRNERESHRAAECARSELRVRLKNSVTALLLHCDLALQIPDLPVEAGKKFLLLHDLATRIRQELEIELEQSASA